MQKITRIGKLQPREGILTPRLLGTPRISRLTLVNWQQGEIAALRSPVLFHFVEGTSVIARTTTLRFLGKATLRTTLLLSRSNE